ncbi:MAG: deoxyribonuclease IV [Actinomycetes bacterium]
MLIGAHVSPAGGLPKAIGRGLERDCDAIQIFSQSPRTWKPTNHTEEAVAEFRKGRDESRIDCVLIHAVYLLNCASDDPDLAAKSRDGLITTLRVGDRIGADAVVLHPGSAKGGDPKAAIARAGAIIAEALSETGECGLHLENTAGAGGTLGRSFGELAALLDAAGGDPRLGVCLDSCHLFASGYEVHTEQGLTATVDECEAEIGLERLRSLHVNDSTTELGSNKDRHAPPGEGLIGPDGLANFLSEPRFEGLPAILEGPGTAGKEAELVDVEMLRQLRSRGLERRG